jgi:hypothetical protein
MKLRLYVMVLVSAHVLAACSSDEDGEGTGGSGDGGAGVGGAGNVGNEGGAGVGGDGGHGACRRCPAEVECLLGGGGEDCDLPLCAGSGDLFNDFAECVCTECTMECAAACNGDEPEAGCDTCQAGSRDPGAPCEMTFMACSADA